MPLLTTIRRSFREHGDPVRAEGMRKYMKSEMPCHGVAAPEVRRLCKAVFAALEFETSEEWRDAVLAVWRGAKFREERYAAIELTGIRRARDWQRIGLVPMYEEMIVSGAWWDFVDTLATNRLGEILSRDRDAMRKLMLRWSSDANLWKRRSAILCQVKLRSGTDLELLYSCIEPSIGSKEFFLRKAIGWALRSYAWTDPQEIVRYVRAREATLSPLTKREALKNVDIGEQAR